MDELLKQHLTNLLVPPGEGVHTVYTGKAKRAKLQSHYYGDTTDISTAFQQHLATQFDQAHVLLLGICSDTGGGILRGANWGPLGIREQIMDHFGPTWLDIGDVRVIPHLLRDEMLNTKTIRSCRAALYGDDTVDYPVSPLSICEAVCDDIYQHAPDKKIFGLGGDHSVSYPLIASYLKAMKARERRVGVVHFDAHTDLLASRLGVDICFGSFAYHILPFLHDPAHLMQIGIRASGKSQNHWESTLGVKQFWAQTCRHRGATAIASDVCKLIDDAGLEGIYITFDIDAIDATYMGTTGTPEFDGLHPEEAMAMISHISERVCVDGADLVEYAPYIQHGAPHAGEAQSQQVVRDITMQLLRAL